MALSIADLSEIFPDITPTPQQDTTDPVCVIAYTPDFTKAFGYLRTIIEKNELTQRALDLTALCLSFNPANYTTWHFRRKCILALDCTVQSTESELEYVTKVGGGNPKNYQVWYHRRSLLETQFKALRDDKSSDVSLAKNELDYIQSVIEVDAKNYHAWSHRQWIVRSIDSSAMWEAEISFTDALILTDVWNNSAWNHRWFAVHRGKCRGEDVTSFTDSHSVVEAEVQYAMDKIAMDVYNDAAWRYLLGLLSEQIQLCQSENSSKNGNDFAHTLLGEVENEISRMSTSLQEFGVENPDEKCVQLMAAHVDLLVWKGDVQAAALLCDDLGTLYDATRCKYWALRARECRQSD